MSCKNKKRGFTLVEILISLAIIGLLAVLIFVYLNPATGKARDAKRKQELAQIGRFLQASGCYEPNGGTGAYDLSELASELITKYPQYSQYMSNAPVDPKTGSVDASLYYYIFDADSRKCALYANLENEGEKITLPGLAEPTPGGGTGVLKAADAGWNGTNIYFQISR